MTTMKNSRPFFIPELQATRGFLRQRSSAFGLFLACLAWALLVPLHADTPSSPRVSRLINADWRFNKGENP